MIQRVQTLFLLAAIGVLIWLILSPIAILTVGDSYFVFNCFGLNNSYGEMVSTNYQVFILFLAIGLINFVSIFLYKNRVRQMRISIYSIIVLILSEAFLYFYIGNYQDQFEGSGYTLQIGFILPVIAAILIFLAWRNIRKDELLIKSLNRLR